MRNAECGISFARSKDRRIKSMYGVPLFEERGTTLKQINLFDTVSNEPNAYFNNSVWRVVESS
jgi:hypothetical protein